MSSHIGFNWYHFIALNIRCFADNNETDLLSRITWKHIPRQRPNYSSFLISVGVYNRANARYEQWVEKSRLVCTNMTER